MLVVGRNFCHTGISVKLGLSPVKYCHIGLGSSQPLYAYYLNRANLMCYRSRLDKIVLYLERGGDKKKEFLIKYSKYGHVIATTVDVNKR